MTTAQPHHDFRTLRALRAAAFLALLLTGSLTAPAATDEARPRTNLHRPGSFWGALTPGYGNVHRSGNGRSESDSGAFFAIQGGFVAHPQWLIGVEYGWCNALDIRLFQDEGLSISSGVDQLLAVAHFYPVADAGFHFQAGVGRVSGAGNLTTLEEDNGLGWMIGLGYDTRVYRKLAISPTVRFTGGKIGDLSTTVWTLGVGISWK